MSASGAGVAWSEYVSATPGAVSATNPDRAALVALYNATGGANWTHSANWLSEEPLNSWQGVTTDDSGRVIELNLTENGLSGEISSVVWPFDAVSVVFPDGSTFNRVPVKGWDLLSAAASDGDLQAVCRPALYRKGPRHCGFVSQPS